MNNLLYKPASWLWRNTLLKWVRSWKKKQAYAFWLEKKTSYGKEYPDKTFYVSRRYENYIGLFSFYIVNVKRVSDALKAGQIPVIDLMNNKNLYLKEDQVGKVNAWEYYFRQPCGYSLSDITHAKRVVLGSGYARDEDMFPYKDVAWLMDPDEKKEDGIAHYRKIVKEHFPLSNDMQKRVEEAWRPYEGKKILGVLCRGTDYTGCRPPGHPKQPTLDELFARIDSFLAQHPVDQIFVGTEDIDAFCAISDRYGKMMVTTNRTHFASYKGQTALGKVMEDEAAYDPREEGATYLTTICMLAKCNYFIAGHTSGTVGVMLMTDGFEDACIFDLGCY